MNATSSAAALSGADAISAEEASNLIEAAAAMLAKIEDRELGPLRAIPRSIATVGELHLIVAALVVLIALRFPQLVDEEDRVPDLAALRYRARN